MNPIPKRLPEPGDFPDLMRLASGYQTSGLILAAHELSLFTKIGGKGRTASAIARSVKCSVRGTTILLDALVALGLLRKRASRYTNSPAARRFLVEDSPHYKGAILSHLRYTAAAWMNLAPAIRSGTSPRIGKKNPILDDPATNRSFILAMHDLGSDLAKLLAAKVDFSAATHLMDLGGGPGSYSIVLCARHKKLKATLVDLPQTLKVARQHLKKFKEARRISLRPADFFRATAKQLGGGYDAALLSNILHAATPAQCVRLLKKVHATLEPGGRIVINEFRLEADRCSPVPGALFAVNMLAATVAGNSYTQKEIIAWLRAAGFQAARSIDLDGVHVATVARKR